MLSAIWFTKSPQPGMSGRSGCRRFTLRHIDYMKGTRELMSIINAAEGMDVSNRNSEMARPDSRPMGTSLGLYRNIKA